MQCACMHACLSCMHLPLGRAVSRVHLPVLELSQGGGPPGSHPREPSPRRLNSLASTILAREDLPDTAPSSLALNG